MIECPMQDMILHAIIIGEAKKPLHYVQEAEVEISRGIVGDRYYYKEGTFNRPELDPNVRDISLIDFDTLQILNNRVDAHLDFLDLRRNLVIKNLHINIKEKNIFTLGSARFKLQRYAPPCRYLSRIVGVDMMQGLKHIGGFRAKVLTSGKIKLADILKLA